MGKICVLGSINMDVVLRVNDIPSSGQTVLSKDFKKVPGGKGANQAIASRRLGADVYMIGKIGKDENGDFLSDCLKKDGINIENVFIDDKNPTGMAIIHVDDKADNVITVVSGANMALKIEDIEKSRSIIKNSDVIVSQFETNMECTIEAFKNAKANGINTILNPAPSRSCPEELLRYTDIIVPNENEAFDITGIEIKDEESAKKAAQKFFEAGVKCVIITLGSRGAAVIFNDASIIVPAHKVKAVDTTAAGDSFIGALAYKLLNNPINFYTIKECVVFANKVSSITVQKSGAQPSIPTLKEVTDVYEK